ncbi:MAG: hypothetical protein R3F56_09650 [Planctomycetota bacterium]
MTSPRSAADLVRRVIDALDGRVIGDVYCDEGGEAFWEERRLPVVEFGLRWGSELRRRLPRGGRSFYVGAGVAELPAMMVEEIELGRTVSASNLRGEECDALNRALSAHGLRLRVDHADALDCAVDVDHIGLVSVASDPETYPLVSGLTYGRLHPALVDVDAFAVERAHVQGLLRTVLERLTLPGLVTTTVEEVPWILAWAEARGVVACADDTMVETAIVGDPIGFLRIATGGAGGATC